MRRLSALDAVDVFRATDSLGLPLGPSQPAALLEAMGTQKDWEDLKVFGALVTVLSDVFTHPNVHYLSGFFGRSEEHTSELQSLMRISYAVFCLTQNKPH